MHPYDHWLPLQLLLSQPLQAIWTFPAALPASWAAPHPGAAAPTPTPCG